MGSYLGCVRDDTGVSSFYTQLGISKYSSDLKIWIASGNI